MKHSALTGAVVTLLTTLLLAACASQPREFPQIEEARAQLIAARADADAQRYANDDIRRAENLLRQAEKLSEKRKAEDQANHLGYLSEQVSRTAIERGRARSADDRLAAAAGERDRVRLEARAAEAERARIAAEHARSLAEQAQNAARNTNERLLAAEQRAQAAEERAATLEQERTQIQGERSARGLVVTFGGDMLFDTGGAELKRGADRRLDNIANFLREHPERHALIEGFTDSLGSSEYNRELSERRAESVRSALVERGVDAARIETEGHGEEYPVGTNADAGGRQLNRRVEVVLSTNDQPVTMRR